MVYYVTTYGNIRKACEQNGWDAEAFAEAADCPITRARYVFDKERHNTVCPYRQELFLMARLVASGRARIGAKREVVRKLRDALYG